MQAEQQSERKRQAAITKVYDKLHEGKLGAHWLWCVIEQIAAGVSEEDAMRDYGYYSRAALSHPSTPQGWQPIESAPKGGRTLLLGYFNSHGKWRTMRGQWISKEYIDDYWEDPEGVEAGWFETPVEAEDPPNCWPTDPTHWMPLPPPPPQGDKT